MNFPLFVARRYFAAKRKKSFISVISNISMLGVGVGTMALVIVMSVFNGMEDLNRQLFKRFDADLRVTPVVGKRFVLDSATLAKIKSLETVRYVTQTVEDNALAHYGNAQMVVKIKGVDDSFQQHHQLDTAMIEGVMQLTQDEEPKAVVGSNVQQALNINPNDLFTPLELWYPRTDTKTLNLTNPDAFRQQIIRVAGIYSLELRFDDYVIVPISFASELLDYGNTRSALELQLTPDADANQVKADVSTLLGTQYKVLTRDEQNADLLRAIRLEKIFVTVTLALIILVAAVNIFFALSMLVIEKQKDIQMFKAMGATATHIKRIFLFEGALVAFTGAILGLVLGGVVCWLQQTFGLVSMGVSNAVVDAYPVKMQATDFIITTLLMIVITLTVSYIPATKAAKLSQMA